MYWPESSRAGEGRWPDWWLKPIPLPRHPGFELFIFPVKKEHRAGGDGLQPGGRRSGKIVVLKMIHVKVESDLCDLIFELCMLCLRSETSSSYSLETIRRQGSSLRTSPVGPTPLFPLADQGSLSRTRAPGLDLREAGSSRRRPRPRDLS